MFRNTLSSLIILSSLSACTDYEIQSIPSVNNGEQASIEVSPTFIDFGIARENELIQREVTVRNVGSSDLYIEDIMLGDGVEAPFSINDSETSTIIPPGGSTIFTVEVLNPTDVEIGNQIYVVSNDEQEEIVEVDVLASMSSPQLSVTPNPLNMGQTYVGCDMENVVILENKGTEELVIMDLAQLGEQFSLIEQPVLPIVLQPGELFPLELVYEPSTESSNQGELHIQSNDPRDAGIYVARQSGMGKIVNEFEQSWENPIEPATDIIFSIDTSGSMSDDANRLAENFETFINELSNYTSDWQIIIANGDNGCMATPSILTPSTPNYKEIFQQNVFSYGGYHTESLLTVAKNAVEQTDSGECNADFLRPNAMLHIVTVSDEPEQSNWTSSMQWNTLVEQIQNKKGNPNMVRVSGITGSVSSWTCAQGGTGYWEAINATGGIWLDICSDWSSIESLEQLAQASVILDSYILDNPAIESTIEVTVNGTINTSDWYFDVDMNAVVFETNIPVEGDHIDIKYGELAICD